MNVFVFSSVILFLTLFTVFVVIYIYGVKTKHIKLFALACLLSAIRCFFSANPVIINDIINVSYQFLYKFDYFMTSINLILLLLIYNDFFKDIVNKKTLIYSSLISIALTGAILIP